MKARLLPAMPEHEYHNDPCKAPSLSSSVASVLVSQSPAHAYAVHPRLGGHKRAPTKEMETGSLIHRLFLGKGPELRIVAAKDWRTQAAKDAREEARENGQIPVLRHKLDEAERTAGKLRQKYNALELGLELDEADRECVVTWQSDTAHGPVWCRCRIDALWRKRATALDLKTTGSAHPKAIAKSCASFGYAIQEAAYREAMCALERDMLGRERFLFVFAELEPPFAMTPADLSGAFRDLGAQQWDRAKDTWAWCLKNDRWPEYGPAIARIEPPSWAMAQEMEED